MNKILATGGTGYIGSHTVVELIKAGYEVDIVDNLFNSKSTVIDKIEEITGKKPNFYKVDLLDSEELEKVFNQNEYDAVLHFAGLKAVGESVEKPLFYFHNNITGTINLLKAMQNHHVNKLIFSSSAIVYGVQDSPEYIETMQTGVGISNPYGRTPSSVQPVR